MADLFKNIGIKEVIGAMLFLGGLWGSNMKNEFDNKLRIEKERVEEYNKQRPDNTSSKKSNVSSNKINMKTMKGKNDDDQ